MFGKPVIKVLTKLDKTNEIIKALEKLREEAVYVGIPQEKNPRKGEPVTNSELAYLHTNGSPLQGIPARPFLEPSIKANLEPIRKLQAEAIGKALAGSPSQVTSSLKKIGQLARDSAKGWFLDPRNGWPPNAPLTIKLKGSDKPLIDTGALKGAITYVIRPDDNPNQ